MEIVVRRRGFFPTAKTAVVMSCILTSVFLATVLSIHSASSAQSLHFFGTRRVYPYVTMHLLPSSFISKKARENPDEI